MPKGVYPRTKEGRANMSNAHKGKHYSPATEFKKGQFVGMRSPFYKGGKTITNNGYVLVLCPSHPNTIRGNYVLEHRRVMERHLGRYLTDNEIVHHINEDKKDNRIDNLKLMSDSEHKRLHINQTLLKTNEVS